MRAILALVGLAALVLVILMSLGMVNLQFGSGTLPTVKLEGGKAPEVKAEVGSIDLTTTNTTVDVPTVTTEQKTITLPSIEVKKAEKAPAAE